MRHDAGSRTLARLRMCCAAGALLALTACAAAPAHGPLPDAPGLRVMTYNIFAGNDLDRQSNLGRVASLIDSLGLDIVFLQEVDRRTARSGDVDQAAIIAERTGLHVIFGSAMDFDGGEYGNAILSRWPVHSSRAVPLGAQTAATPGAQAAEPRTLLHVVVGTTGGTLHLLNTHLDHREAPAARHAQLLELLAYVADAVPRHEPVIFGGDLNARPHTPEVRALALLFSDAWPACGAGDGYTFRSDRPDRRIDYIMLAGLRCSRAWVPDTQLSDHRPVIVELQHQRHDPEQS
jgi:endonuclease/exonuclease/phosphatase family metal-dependent hydrolase